MVHGVPVKVETALSDILPTPGTTGSRCSLVAGSAESRGSLRQSIKGRGGYGGYQSGIKERLDGTEGDSCRALALKTEQDEEKATIMGLEGRKEEERTEGAGADVTDPEPLGSTLLKKGCCHNTLRGVRTPV